ncbi:hypothetical protein LPB136_05340 [Tenacibaculum todarodis]|uniref:Chloroplast import component protein (Tic20) n=1 Tax=Tenacibaculum todarodis TaxID=1850252 RepID=A0A1L3JI68_9FLAO|nr:hypothetical protein [Tenacibaculum todarodis]APG64818.1 hypothetical protein LPB136_05340 [Tenacibaculum todarodis]
MEKLPTTVEEGKTNAIISYITIIGTIVALILNNSKKNAFASFHIRQMIGLCILQILNGWVVTRFLGVFVGGAITLILLVLWIIGFMGALKGEEKLVPVVGAQFQDWFKGI